MAAAVFFLIMPFLILLVSSVAGYLLKHTVPQLYDNFCPVEADSKYDVIALIINFIKKDEVAFL